MRTWVTLGVAVAIFSALVLPPPCLAGVWCGYGYPNYNFLYGATSFYMGYFQAPNRVTLSFENKSPSAIDLNAFLHRVDLQGFWLELLLPVRGCGPRGAMFGAAYHFPFTKTSEETRNTGGVGQTLTWDVAPEWWSLQLGLTYDVVPGLAALAGLKYDSFQVNFFNVRPQLPSTVSAFQGIGDRADVSINQYLPYVGLAYKRALPPAGCEIELGAIGFPFVPGSVDFSESVHSGLTIGGIGPQTPRLGLFPLGFPASGVFTRGSFMECFGEISLPVRDLWQAGAFARYSLTQASTVVDPGERSRAQIPPPDNLHPSPGSFGIPRVNYDFTFDRRVWSVGGVLSFNF